MAVALVPWLPATAAVQLALALAVVTLALRVLGRHRSLATVTGEAALILVLYAGWQYAGSLHVSGGEGAQGAGLQLDTIERDLGWPRELSWQRAILGAPWIVNTANAYYAILHVPVLVATLVWVLVLRRRDWAFTRTTLALVTAACLLIQYRPVAPPRLIPQLGIVDTAELSGSSIYDAIPGANQYAAMPSVHIAWAAMVALVIVVSGRSRWRWLAVLYPLTTLWVVVVTGNHFLIDGVAAVALLTLAAGITLTIPSQRPERFRRRSELPEPDPDEQARIDVPSDA